MSAVKPAAPAQIVDVTFTGNVTLDIPEHLRPIKLGDLDLEPRLWELSGACDGSTIRARRSKIVTSDGRATALVLTVKNEAVLAKPMVRQIYALADEAESVIDVIENVEFYLREELRGQGIGRTSLQIEAVAAYELGFGHLIANAAGRPGDPQNSGWVAWPRMGYDAEIPPDIVAKMPPQVLAAAGLDADRPLRISDLWDAELYSLWEKYGEGLIMRLDTSSLESWSMRRLLDAGAVK